MTDAEASESGTSADAKGTPAEVFFAFLKLGVSCFGGPIAHLGYFREEFVARRKWLKEEAYADLIALAQFLPGPASSQVGFSIGLLRAGWRGGLMAFLAFTLPSALLMLGFAYGARLLNGRWGDGLLHGLRLVAVAVVAQAVIGMARRLCPDFVRAVIAIVVVLMILASGSSAMQIAAIALGGIVGLIFCRSETQPTGEALSVPISPGAGIVFIALYFILLGGLPLLAHLTTSTGVALFESFYRSGALVFGGGHVVLPLLRQAVVAPGWVSDQAFLNGYGAAQALPGPLFTFAAYLGAIVKTPPNGIAGAAIALIAIFLPGLLAMSGTLSFWDRFRRQPQAQAAMGGINAAVVGLLAAALYNPLWTTSVKTLGDVVLALIGFALLTLAKAPPILVVIASALGGIALAFLNL
ncbi:MAG TPA: chromate efflux transporter [Methylovirgula sp.]|jgi:chromate transporter